MLGVACGNLRHVENRHNLFLQAWKFLDLSRRHIRLFYTLITAVLIASQNRERISPLTDAGTYLAIFYADRSALPLQFCSQTPSIVAVRHFEMSCDKSRPTWLVGSSRWTYIAGRAHKANAAKLNRRCLTCQIPAILYVDRSDRRNRPQ